MNVRNQQREYEESSGRSVLHVLPVGQRLAPQVEGRVGRVGRAAQFGLLEEDLEQAGVLADAHAELVEDGDHEPLDRLRVVRGAVVEQGEQGPVDLHVEEQMGLLIRLHLVHQALVVPEMSTIVKCSTFVSCQ
jgi:hypothetical protein